MDRKRQRPAAPDDPSSGAGAPAVLLAHLTGNPNSRQAALAFAEAGWLTECHTTLAWPQRSPLVRWLPIPGRSQIARRAFPELVEPHIKPHPWHELGRLVARHGLLPGRISRMFTIERVARRFDRAVARRVASLGSINAVYGYADSSVETFKAARARGVMTLYELPTPYWRAVKSIVADENQRTPDWAPTMPPLDADSELVRRRDEELQLADVVIVPSELVRESLKRAPAFKAEVMVVPYGCLAADGGQDAEDENEEGGLRVLFVGTLAQSKGLADLAAALGRLGNGVSLTIIGGRATAAPCPALDAVLTAHRYLGALPQAEVLAEMKRHHVLVLPTLYEGLALVLLEAMSCGMTVVTTDRSGLAGLIENGREGFIVPAQDPTALAARLRLLADDRERLTAMRSAARSWAQSHSWQDYRERLRRSVEEAFAHRRPAPRKAATE